MAVPSFPDVSLTGAVHHFIRARTSVFGDDIFYLGTAEITPQMQRRKFTQDVMNDKAGKTLPLQRTYDGEAATISVLLTYFSIPAWAAILNAGSSLGVEGVNGEETRWSRGGAVFGVRTFELWQVFENALNPPTATAGLEIGWFWPQVQLVSHDDMKLGTQGRGLLMVMDAQPFHYGEGYAANPGGWALYTNDPAFFPTDVQVFQ